MIHIYFIQKIILGILKKKRNRNKKKVIMIIDWEENLLKNKKKVTMIND